jgi:hypothetical protein
LKSYVFFSWEVAPTGNVTIKVAAAMTFSDPKEMENINASLVIGGEYLRVFLIQSPPRRGRPAWSRGAVRDHLSSLVSTPD